jgi:hypothetical protein
MSNRHDKSPLAGREARRVKSFRHRPVMVGRVCCIKKEAPLGGRDGASLGPYGERVTEGDPSRGAI